jgi:hypothetical protein
MPDIIVLALMISAAMIALGISTLFMNREQA